MTATGFGIPSRRLLLRAALGAGAIVSIGCHHEPVNDPDELAKPRPPEFTLQYLGSFGSANRRIAVFTDGKTVHNLQEGQVLEGKFIVARIGYESVDIKFVNFPDEPAKRLGIQRRR